MKSRKFHQEQDKDRVKLYKTRHGWFSCLTRFFRFLHFGKKEDVRAQPFTNRDEISDKVNETTASTLKGIGLLSTILGASVLGTTSTTTVHAAVDAINQADSQVVGSGSTTNSTSTSQSSSDSGSNTGSNSVSQTNSGSGSNSSSHSNSNSGSNSLSKSGSTSGSYSTSGSNSYSGSQINNGSTSSTSTTEQNSDELTLNSLAIQEQKQLSVDEMGG